MPHALKSIEPAEWSHLRAAITLDDAARNARDRIIEIVKLLSVVRKTKRAVRELLALSAALDRALEIANREMTAVAGLPAMGPRLTPDAVHARPAAQLAIAPVLPRKTAAEIVAHLAAKRATALRGAHPGH